MTTQRQYILGKRIARGGMAEIFLAKLLSPKSTVPQLCAIKKILPHYAQETEYLEMFRNEAVVSKTLEHINIAQVYDFTKIDDSHAMVMEFVDGTDLRTLLAACEKNKVRLNIPMAVTITILAARGLHYAHTKTDPQSGRPLDIVHRDISPQNILVGFDGAVKVIDFGIAKFEAKQQETKPGVVKGKYSYMSPEQIGAKQLDARTDVFSLAIVLWEMLSMKRLFAGETEVETIRNVQGCIIKRPLVELNPLVDSELHDIILQGLARDRKRRFESAALFERALMRYMAQRFNDFKIQELGDFVGGLFESRRLEIQRYISELMTPPKSLTPNPDETAARAVVLSLDVQQPALNLQTTSSENSAPQVAAISRQQLAPSRQPSRTQNRLAPFPIQAERTQSPILAITVILGIVMIAFAIWFQRRGDAPATLLLSTQPRFVMVHINGQKSDQYRETPREISLRPGQYQLQIAREGYITTYLEVKAKPGEKLKAQNIKLRRDPNRHFLNLQVVADKKVNVMINDGEGRASTPFTELVAHRPTLELLILPSDGVSSFRCAIKVQSQPRLLSVRIETQLSRCSATVID